MNPIQMVDLKSQYEKIKPKIDQSILNCIASTAFIIGQQVKYFQKSQEEYLGVKQVIPCANGTDALQIALHTGMTDKILNIVIHRVKDFSVKWRFNL